jgi:hypothetical protein
MAKLNNGPCPRESATFSDSETGTIGKVDCLMALVTLCAKL